MNKKEIKMLCKNLHIDLFKRYEPTNPPKCFLKGVQDELFKAEFRIILDDMSWFIEQRLGKYLK